jgi:hypothetical protein
MVERRIHRSDFLKAKANAFHLIEHAVALFVKDAGQRSPSITGRTTMSLYTSLHTIASEWWAAHRALRTERLVGGLPLEIQKDIGWPDSLGRTRWIVGKQTGRTQ